MALPFVFESNFEVGDNTEWDSESDTGSKLDIVHYTTLANTPGAPAPYRGAYCMQIDLTSGDTNDHVLIEGDIDIADGSTSYFRWYQYVSANFTATADDTFNIFELQQAGGTNEMVVGMRITAASNLLEIGVGDASAPTSFVDFPRGKWVCVELLATPSTGGSGVLTLFLNGNQVASVTSLTQAAAIGRGVFGTQDTLATTTGKIWFDQFAQDDARVFPLNPRFPEEVLLTKSGHVFVGGGRVENITLLSGAGTDCVMSVYDTDNAYSSGYNQKMELKNISAGEVVDPAGVPLVLQRGCYVTLSGTTPRAIVKIGHAQGYWSDGRIKQHGHRRLATPGGW